MIPKTIKIGYEGEKCARFVNIDISELLTLNDGTANILHKRAGDTEAYPVTVTRNGSILRSVIRADVVLLNETLIPCKSEHYLREITSEPEADAE